MLRGNVRQKPRQSQLKAFPAPVGGWVSNRNLAQPQQPGQPQGAAVLDNFFPLATSAILRRGSERYATLGDGSLPTLSMFTYIVGVNQKLFAATENTIYDITIVLEAENALLGDEDGDNIVDDEGDDLGWFSTENLEVAIGYTGGDWVTTQFATTGSIYLVGVNGANEGFIYDGANFYPWVEGGIHALNFDGEVDAFTAGLTLTGATSGATATIVRVIDNGTTGTLWLRDVVGGPFDDNETIEDSGTGEATANGINIVVAPGPTFSGGKTTADMSFLWVYKNTLFFIEKDTLSAHYLDVDSVGGAATELPLGGTFVRGGALLFGQPWSLDTGGGLSDQCAFVSTEGEVAVFQGSDPSDANDWGKVGVYRIGVPLGHKAFIRGGGDILIATSVGFIPLSTAVSREYAALFQAATSYAIEDAWNSATQQRGLTGWHAITWPEGQMVMVVPPLIGGQDAMLFAANARTGAWSRFTNWEAICTCVFKGKLYFGSTDGRVVLANVGGNDEGETYTGSYLPLFEDFGSPASAKIGQLARPVLRSSVDLDIAVSLHCDFDLDLPTPPPATLGGSGSQWGVGIWGASTWGDARPTVITQDWQSVGGIGYAMSPATQVTSGDVIPLDAEIIRTELTFQTADIVT